MNAPLTKVEFCVAINSIKEYWDKIREIENSLEVIFSSGVFVDIVDRYIDTLCAAMKDEFGIDDSHNGEPWIMYFCFEKDFGRKKKDEVFIIGKENFPLNTSEDLYRWLIKLYWEEED